jgi:hypothetical protein
MLVMFNRFYMSWPELVRRLVAIPACPSNAHRRQDRPGGDVPIQAIELMSACFRHNFRYVIAT